MFCSSMRQGGARSLQVIHPCKGEMETIFLLYKDMYNTTFRKVALSLYHYFGNMKSVAKALKIGIGTIWRWINNGIEPKERIKVPFSEASVQQFVMSNNHATQQDMQKEVQRVLGHKVSRRCISMVLKIIGLTRKRLKNRGLHPNAVPIASFLSFKSKVGTASQLVSIDETGFDQRMTPIYGYSMKGTKAIGVTRPRSRIRTNLLMAIDATGKSFFITRNQPITGSDVVTFISSLPWPKPTVLIMDKLYTQGGDEVLRQRRFAASRLCRNCPSATNGKRRNRDVNASKNMLTLLTCHIAGLSRPEHLVNPFLQAG